jgi:hypothetical protein
MVAAAVPVIAIVVEIPFLFDPVPRPSVISIYIALAVGTVFAILGFGFSADCVDPACTAGPVSAERQTMEAGP